MRSFVPRYEVAFSGGVFYAGGGKVVFPDGEMFNTSHTKETHNKNSISRTFCREAKRAAGGTALNRSNIFLCRPRRPRQVRKISQTTSCRPRKLRASVNLSAYSKSPPTGIPVASRVIFMSPLRRKS